MEHKNTSYVLNLLIEKLAIPVTRSSVEEEIAMHPNSHSLLAISDILSNWNVPNAAFQLPFDELVHVPVPFIAYSNKEFVIVEGLDEHQVTISNEHFNSYIISIAEFKKSYNGTILAAEKDELSGEINYAGKRRMEIINRFRSPFVVTGFIAVFLVILLINPSYNNTFQGPIAFLIMLKTVGLFISILLLIQSIDSNNPLIGKICNSNNSENCNAILSSKAAKISAELSWSEVGFFYFAGTWLYILSSNEYDIVMQSLALLNIMSLPYTFYSIYYQWRVAKQWCVFCCTILALLWFEFFAFLPYLLDTILFPELNEIVVFLVCMFMPILIWIFVKPFIMKSSQLQPLRQQLGNFKYNADLFHKLLNDEIRYSLLSEEYSLVIGNHQAKNTITLVSNPYCQPCSQAHKDLEWISGRDDIKLQIIFASHDDKVASHLMSLQASENEFSIREAIDSWYDQKLYETWAKEYPLKKQITSSIALDQQKAWCKSAEISGTPTLFINGQRLPQYYEPKDIKYFI